MFLFYGTGRNLHSLLAEFTGVAVSRQLARLTVS
jgi:hypothetical protein